MCHVIYVSKFQEISDGTLRIRRPLEQMFYNVHTKKCSLRRLLALMKRPKISSKFYGLLSMLLFCD